MTTLTSTTDKDENSFLSNAWTYVTGSDAEQDAAKDKMFSTALTTLKDEFLPSSKGEGLSLGGINLKDAGKRLMATAGLFGVLKFIWGLFSDNKDKNTNNNSGFGLGTGLAVSIGGAALAYAFGDDIKNALSPKVSNPFAPM